MATLQWGIRASFLQYLSHAGPHQVIGNRSTPNGPFEFTQVDAYHPEELAFAGLVDITAYGGLLRLVIRDPTLNPKTTKLTVGLDDPGQRIELLTLSPAGPGRWQTHLTISGSALFDYVYPPGTQMDDVLIEESPSAR